MPNGFHGTRAEWERLTAPLLKLDPALETFIAQHGLRLAKSPRNWPSRDIRGSDSLDRLIQINATSLQLQAGCLPQTRGAARPRS
jgi:hypothetical protein